MWMWRFSWRSNLALRRTILAVAALIAVLAGGATLAAEALASACAAGCRAQHNQCRISTKGSSSCDARLQQCLQSCMRR
jgi:hypothetical protein